MAVSTINSDVTVNGRLQATTMTVPADSVSNASIKSDANIDRSKIGQTTLARFVVPWADFRVWDAYQTTLPGTPATDDLGLVGGTFGTASPTIQTEDLKAAGSTTKYARFMLTLPPEYDTSETVQISITAGMLTTVADTACTLDVEAYETDKFAGIGSDLVSTAAQSINSLTEAEYDFTVDASGLPAGAVLDVRLTVVVNDAASGTAVKAQLGSVELRCDIRG